MVFYTRRQPHHYVQIEIESVRDLRYAQVIHNKMITDLITTGKALAGGEHNLYNFTYGA